MLLPNESAASPKSKRTGKPGTMLPPAVTEYTRYCGVDKIRSVCTCSLDWKNASRHRKLASTANLQTLIADSAEVQDILVANNVVRQLLENHVKLGTDADIRRLIATDPYTRRLLLKSQKVRKFLNSDAAVQRLLIASSNLHEPGCAAMPTTKSGTPVPFKIAHLHAELQKHPYDWQRYLATYARHVKMNFDLNGGSCLALKRARMALRDQISKILVDEGDKRGKHFYVNRLHEAQHDNTTGRAGSNSYNQVEYCSNLSRSERLTFARAALDFDEPGVWPYAVTGETLPEALVLKLGGVGPLGVSGPTSDIAAAFATHLNNEAHKMVAGQWYLAFEDEDFIGRSAGPAAYPRGIYDMVKRIGTLFAPAAGIERPSIMIAQQPAPQTVAIGGNATFSLNAAVRPYMRIQWQSLAPGAKEFTDIHGATGDVLNIANCQLQHEGMKYRARVRCGNVEVYSEAVSLLIDNLQPIQTPPSHHPIEPKEQLEFYSNPSPEKTIEDGDKLELYAASKPFGAKIQWQRSNGLGQPFFDIPAARTNYYSCKVTLADSGSLFRAYLMKIGYDNCYQDPPTVLTVIPRKEQPPVQPSQSFRPEKNTAETHAEMAKITYRGIFIPNGVNATDYIKDLLVRETVDKSLIDLPANVVPVGKEFNDSGKLDYGNVT